MRTSSLGLARRQTSLGDEGKSRSPTLRLELLEDRLAPAADVGDTIQHALNTRLAGPGAYAVTSEELGNGRQGARDVDFYQFSTTTGTQLLKVTLGTPSGAAGIYPYVRLFDSTGTEMPGGTGYSDLEYYFTGAGTYYLGVSGYPNYQYDPTIAGSGQESWYLGSYSLNVTLSATTPDAAGDTIAIANASGLGSATPAVSFTAKIGDGAFGERDVDLYKLDAAANQILTVATSTPTGGIAIQPVLRVFDAGGQQLTWGYNYVGSDLQLKYQFTTAGTYYVGVSGFPNYYYDPNTTANRAAAYTPGDYKLDLVLTTPTADAAGDSIATAQATGLGPADGTFSATARIGDGLYPLRDVDIYKFDSAAGQVLEAAATVPTGGTSNYERYLRLFNSSGQVLGQWGGFGYAPSLKYQFAAAGTYYIGFSAGSYGNNYDPNVAGSLQNYGYDVGNADYTLSLKLSTPVAGTDVGGTTATAQPLSVAADGTASVTSVVGDGLTPLADVDLYSFSATGGQLLTFSVTTPTGGTAVSPSIRLFNSSGQQLSYSSFNGLRYQFEGIDTQTYYLGISNVSAYNAVTGAPFGSSLAYGDYTLSLAFSTPTAGGDAADTIPAVTATSLDGTAAGFTSGSFTTSGAKIGDGLTPLKDVDLYRVDAKADQVLTSTQSSSNTVLRLFNASGGQLAFASFGAKIEYQIPATGTYFVGISSVYSSTNYNPNTLSGRAYALAGDYTLTLGLTTPAPDAAGETRETALATNLGPANGTFTSSGAKVGDGLFPFRDVDLYKFDAAAGQGLLVNASSAVSYLYLGFRLFDASGVELATGGGYSFTTSSQYIKFQFAESGTYYLGVSGADRMRYDPVTGDPGTVYPTSALTRGDYTLSLTLLTPPTDAVGDMIATALDTGISDSTNTYTMASARIGDGWFGGADVDMYKITASAGQALSAVTSYPASGGSYTYLTLRLFDANGNQLANTGYSYSYPALRDYVFSAAGTYYIGVSAQGNTSYNPKVAGSGYSYYSGGDYSLALNLVTPTPDDEGDTRASALATGLGPSDGTYAHDTQIGNGLYLSKDVDFYRFEGRAGQVVSVTTAATGGNYFGTYLRLYDAAGNVVAEDYSLLEVTLTRAGTYTVGVSGQLNYGYDPDVAGSGNQGLTGDYHLVMALVTPTPDAVGDTIATALNTKLGPNAGSYVMASGRVGDGLYVGRDVDMYQFKAQKGQVFRAATSLPPGGAGGNIGLTLFDASGYPLAYSYSYDVNTSTAMLEFTVPQAGTYYLGVSGSGNWYDPNLAGSGYPADHGDYRLEMSLDKLIRNPVGGGKPVARVTGNGVDAHQTGSDGSYQFVDHVSINAWLDEQGQAHGTILWDTTSHSFPAGQRARAGDAWSIRVDTLAVSGNVAHVEGIVVSDGGNNGDHTSNYVGSRVAFDIEDNGSGKLDRLNGWELLSGNFTITDRRAATLHAEATGPGMSPAALTPAEVQPLLEEAVRRWAAAGEDTSALAGVSVQVADLDGTSLGLAVGNAILLDDDAAGWGWFVDATPSDDAEFATPGDQGEQGRIDLLTVLVHELGHLLGHEHDEGGVMSERLGAGGRLTEWDGQPVVAGGTADPAPQPSEDRAAPTAEFASGTGPTWPPPAVAPAASAAPTLAPSLMWMAPESITVAVAEEPAHAPVAPAVPGATRSAAAPPREAGGGSERGDAVWLAAAVAEPIWIGLDSVLCADPKAKRP